MSFQEFNLRSLYIRAIVYFIVFLIAIIFISGSDNISLAQRLSWASKNGTWNFNDKKIFGAGVSGFNKAFCSNYNFSDFIYEVRLRKISRNEMSEGKLVVPGG